MLRKIKCKNCMEIKSEPGRCKCYSCNTSGCSKCIKTACCDCCVIMCKNCNGNGESNCGCYGNCSSCGNSVDRGNNGWPCIKCKKWYCDYCKHKSKCMKCKLDD